MPDRFATFGFDLRDLEGFCGLAYFTGLWLLLRSRPRRLEAPAEPALT